MRFPETPKQKLQRSKFWRFGLAPAFIYFVAFCFLTAPLITRFSTHFFADAGDGLQNVWNVWWVNKAIAELHTSPWYTRYLHYPLGTTLIAHTLNPFNGLVCVILLRFMTLVQAFNTMVIFSFVVGGLTAFWLAHYMTRHYSASLMGGYFFTFSQYHFAHAEGHLQLVSLEWLPLFILSWYIFVQRPRLPLAVLSSLVLLLVILCDYYYFFYSVIAASVMLVWQIASKRSLDVLWNRRMIVSQAVFGVTSLATSGVIAISLVVLGRHDPLSGAQDITTGGGHNSRVFSLDPASLIIPGGHWRFAHLTESHWSRLPGIIHESSVSLGIGMLFLLVVVCVKRKELSFPTVWLWLFIFALFTTLGLGPNLRFNGYETSLPSWIMPYTMLERLLPPLKMSGVPVRMVVMSTLSASIICARGLAWLLKGTRKMQLVGITLFLIMVVEQAPRPMPATPAVIPSYAQVLRGLPGSDGIIDLFAPASIMLYCQTIHEKPMAFGYISRIPRSVASSDKRIYQLLSDGKLGILRQSYNLRYLVVPADAKSRVPGAARVLHQDRDTVIFDLATWRPKVP